MAEKGYPLPKFGEWDVNDPASAEGFTVIFNKARDEKKTGGTPESPARANPQVKNQAEPVKPQAVRCSHYCINYFSLAEWISYIASTVFTCPLGGNHVHVASVHIKTARSVILKLRISSFCISLFVYSPFEPNQAADLNPSLTNLKMGICFRHIIFTTVQGLELMEPNTIKGGMVQLLQTGII